MRKAERTLTAQELAIMKIVWRAEAATVRDVYETLRKTRPVAYTTVMTMMNILEDKGYLSKTRQSRAFLYQPTRPQGLVVGGMVREFVNRVFDGASTPLLLQLVRETRLTKAERDKLLRLIQDAK
jgi:BlaI family penicillinase repressor